MPLWLRFADCNVDGYARLAVCVMEGLGWKCVGDAANDSKVL
jgi:hypothetical protein